MTRLFPCHRLRWGRRLANAARLYHTRLRWLTLDPRACIRLGTAHARRRTLATALQAFARSMLTSLRHPWLRLSATPAPGYGQPLAALPRSTGFQPVCLPGSYWARMRFRKGEHASGRLRWPYDVRGSSVTRITALGLSGSCISRPAVRPRAHHAGRGVWVGSGTGCLADAANPSGD